MHREIITAQPLSLTLLWRDGRLVALDLAWAEPQAPQGPEPTSETGRRLAEALDRYVAGERVDWPELPLELEEFTDFRRAVLETLAREIRHGQVTTYGRLAALVGRPRAARAVGRVMATNPWPLVIPCHRVLGSGGSLTGFGPGVEMKKFLLDLERKFTSG